MIKHSRVNIRKTHPTLYHSLMVIGFMCVFLGINFWYSTPTFNPLGINKNLVGVVFFLLGISKLIFLNWLRNLKIVRLSLAFSIAVMIFWGLINSQQSFLGKASFQLPILYLSIAALQVPLLIESPVNPMTEKE